MYLLCTYPHSNKIFWLKPQKISTYLKREENVRVRKLGHRPGGYGNAVEDYWPLPGRSLMQAHPYSSWLSNIKALKLVKAVAGLKK
jgi:hypothetical protein